MTWAVTVVLGVALLGCGAGRTAGGSRSSESVLATPPQPPSQWPSPEDYQAIAVAARVRSDALYRLDWRQKQYAAFLALDTLRDLHVMLPGPCATFAVHIYAELLDLHSAYRGEDWRPMVAIVRHDPDVAQVCKPPRRPHIAYGA